MKWKILNECNRYEISENGDVRNISTGDYRKATVGNRGYKVLSFTLDCGSRKSFQLHRLVALNFLKPPTKEIIDSYSNSKNKTVKVDHINRNKLDNHVSNLRWCTTSQNNKNVDFIRSGAGSKFSKISTEQLQELVDAHHNGILITSVYAEKFGVDPSCINKHLRKIGICRAAKRS